MRKTIFLTIIICSLFSTSHSCDLDAFKLNQDSIANWLGDNSKFSKAYREGKCVLDRALINIPLEQKSIIAKLIAKSYVEDKKKTEKVSTYNY